MSQENDLPPIDKEPLPSNGSNKVAIELPADGKKEIELVMKNDKVVNQTKASYAPEMISNKKVSKSCKTLRKFQVFKNHSLCIQTDLSIDR